MPKRKNINFITPNLHILNYNNKNILPLPGFTKNLNTLKFITNLIQFCTYDYIELKIDNQEKHHSKQEAIFYYLQSVDTNNQSTYNTIELLEHILWNAVDNNDVDLVITLLDTKNFFWQKSILTPGNIICDDESDLIELAIEKRYTTMALILIQAIPYEASVKYLQLSLTNEQYLIADHIFTNNKVAQNYCIEMMRTFAKENNLNAIKYLHEQHNIPLHFSTFGKRDVKQHIIFDAIIAKNTSIVQYIADKYNIKDLMRIFYNKKLSSHYLYPDLLQFACYTGDINIATLFFQKLITQQNSHQHLNIHPYIVKNQQTYMKRLLLSSQFGKGIDKNIPLFYAILGGHTEIVKLFLEYNAEQVIYCNDGMNVIHVSANSPNDNVELFEFLLERFKERSAAHNIKIDIPKLLLLPVKDDAFKNITPLESAFQKKNIKIVTKMLEYFRHNPNLLPQNIKETCLYESVRGYYSVYTTHIIKNTNQFDNVALLDIAIKLGNLDLNGQHGAMAIASAIHALHVQQVAYLIQLNPYILHINCHQNNMYLETVLHKKHDIYPADSLFFCKNPHAKDSFTAMFFLLADKGAILRALDEDSAILRTTHDKYPHHKIFIYAKELFSQYDIDLKKILEEEKPNYLVKLFKNKFYITIHNDEILEFAKELMIMSPQLSSYISEDNEIAYVELINKIQNYNDTASLKLAKMMLEYHRYDHRANENNHIFWLHNYISSNGKTLLHITTENNMTLFNMFLPYTLLKLANVQTQDNNQNTALHSIAQGTSIVEYIKINNSSEIMQKYALMTIGALAQHTNLEITNANNTKAIDLAFTQACNESIINESIILENIVFTLIAIGSSLPEISEQYATYSFTEKITKIAEYIKQDSIFLCNIYAQDDTQQNDKEYIRIALLNHLSCNLHKTPNSNIANTILETLKMHVFSDEETHHVPTTVELEIFARYNIYNKIYRDIKQTIIYNTKYQLNYSIASIEVINMAHAQWHAITRNMLQLNTEYSNNSKLWDILNKISHNVDPMLLSVKCNGHHSFLDAFISISSPSKISIKHNKSQDIEINNYYNIKNLIKLYDIVDEHDTYYVEKFLAFCVEHCPSSVSVGFATAIIGNDMYIDTAINT